jgi:hypothetical protein
LDRSGFYYVGRRYVEKPGTYESPYDGRAFNRAIGVLTKHHFFQLNYGPPADPLVTDTSNLVIAVERCGVTTMLTWPESDARPDLIGLFDSLDAIAKGISWHKTSDSESSP